MNEEYKILTVIDGVTILAAKDEKYIRFVSNLDVCNDGSGPAHGDPRGLRVVRV